MAYTALITGASGGIGLELAWQAAKQGHNVVLVARSLNKLEQLGADIQGKHKVEVTVISADLAQQDSAENVYGEIQHRKLQIDILINNAGFALYGEFATADPQAELNMLNLNMITLTKLSKLFLPAMIERKWGRILNVASTAAFMPGPLMAIYYASKAYVLSFTEAINEELRNTGVQVTALCPGPTETGFQERASMEESKLVRGKKIMTAASVAAEGYQGMLQGETVIIPGTMNKIQSSLPRIVPRSFIPGIVRRAQERA